MAINPMQRKARNSFLLGMLIMFIIGAIIVAILIMMISGMQNQEQQGQLNSQIAYRLKSDIKSGQPITGSDIEAVGIEMYQLVDKASGKVSDSKMDTMANTGSTSLANTNLQKASVATGINKETIVKKGDLTENTVAKVDLPKGTILTTDMVALSDEQVTKDLRIQEYNMVLLPTDLARDDYIDIRIFYPNGQDYIVVSKKRVITSSQNTIFLKLTEEEILTMSNAIVEAWKIDGAYLRAIKYETPGVQEAATVTYPVSRDVLDIINNDPNVIDTARTALWKRYNDNNQAQVQQRATIDTILSNNADDAIEKVNAGITAQIQAQEMERLRYIETLGTGADY